MENKKVARSRRVRPISVSDYLTTLHIECSPQNAIGHLRFSVFQLPIASSLVQQQGAFAVPETIRTPS